MFSHSNNKVAHWAALLLNAENLMQKLAFASHWDLVGEGGFALLWVDPGTRIIPESWADAVQWGLTNLEYQKLGQKFGNYQALNYNFQAGSQGWYKGRSDYYTPIFIDLIDDKNQRIEKGEGYPNDLIYGYTLSFIHNNILKKSYGLSSLRDEIKKNKITGVTDEQIDELFALYW